MTIDYYGEVSEWLKEQPWKGCVGLVPTKGSNPFLSVLFYAQKYRPHRCAEGQVGACRESDGIAELEYTMLLAKSQAKVIGCVYLL
jgi:hypothetical protein